MGQMVVRNLEDDVIEAIKARAAANQRSAEAEHRSILREAVRGRRRKTFAEVLASMPNVGEDRDFDRHG